jgi:hypothetical protein
LHTVWWINGFDINYLLNKVLDGLLNVSGFNPGSQQYKVCARWNVKDLMERCWNDDPTERPNFNQIKKHLEEDSGVDL